MINNLEVSVFAYEGEKEKVKEALLKIFPFNPEKYLQEKKALGFNEKPIYVFSVYLKRRSLAGKTLKYIINKISDADKVFILNTLESRLSENLHFHFRLDKESWIKGITKITDKGNCFHFKVSILAFPKKRELALNELKDMFSIKTFL